MIYVLRPSVDKGPLVVPSELDDITEEVSTFIERCFAPHAIIFKTPGPWIRTNLHPPGQYGIVSQITPTQFKPDESQPSFRLRDPIDVCPKRLADLFYRDWETKTSGYYRDWVALYRSKWPGGPDPIMPKPSRFEMEPLL